MNNSCNDLVILLELLELSPYLSLYNRRHHHHHACTTTAGLFFKREFLLIFRNSDQPSMTSFDKRKTFGTFFFRWSDSQCRQYKIIRVTSGKSEGQYGPQAFASVSGGKSCWGSDDGHQSGALPAPAGGPRVPILRSFHHQPTICPHCCTLY